MWLQDTAGEVGVPYHLIKSGRARGDVLVLTKLKGKAKDISSSFVQNQRNCQGLESQSKETQNCFPMYFLNNLWLSTFLPLPQRHRYKGKRCRGRETPFITEKLSKISAGGGW